MNKERAEALGLFKSVHEHNRGLIFDKLESMQFKKIFNIDKDLGYCKNDA